MYAKRKEINNAMRSVTLVHYGSLKMLGTSKIFFHTMFMLNLWPLKNFPYLWVINSTASVADRKTTVTFPWNSMNGFRWKIISVMLFSLTANRLMSSGITVCGSCEMSRYGEYACFLRVTSINLFPRKSILVSKKLLFPMGPQSPYYLLLFYTFRDGFQLFFVQLGVGGRFWREFA